MDEIMTPKEGKSFYIGARRIRHGQPIPTQFTEKASKDMLETYKEKTTEVKIEASKEMEDVE